MKLERTLQEPVVQAFLSQYPQAQTRGWRAAAIDAFQEPEDDEGDFRKAVVDLALIPDLFIIDKEARQIDFFEVEVTSPMSRAKLQSYAVFVTIMDFYEVGFSVFTVNQHGHINEVNLLLHYEAWLNEQRQS